MKHWILRVLAALLVLVTAAGLLPAAAFAKEAERGASIGAASAAALAEALREAKSGDTVRVEADITLTEDLTVPEGVTLLIPCVESDVGYIDRDDGNGGIIRFNQDGTDTAGNTGVGPNAYRYRLLTVPQGVTLTVNGTLMVNAVTGRPVDEYVEQDVTGGYGELGLEGTIIVNGTLESFGYIRGSGTITANDGATVGDLYVVRHWRSANKAIQTVPYAYPMNEYDLHNIESKLIVHSGATYTALVKLFAGTRYRYTRFPQFDKSNGLLRPRDGAILTKTYLNGREKWSIDGGADFASSTLKLLGITLSTGMNYFVYPIDGDIDFELRGGEYRICNDFKFLPGATMRVYRGASVEITQKHILAFYDKFDDRKYYSDGTAYPADRSPAVLAIAKGAVLTNNGTFAGNIDGTVESVRLGEQSAPATTYPSYENGPWSVKTYEANGSKEGAEVYVRTLDFSLRYVTHNHVMTYVAEKKVSCTENGNSAYYYCELCDKYFADAAGAREISKDSLTIPATGHDLRYTAEGAVMTEVCSRGDHTATATLTAADAVYSGEAVGTAAVTYSDGWLGGELTVTYANNVSAGTATATVTKAGATAAVRFEIAKCADCTLALGSLNQTIERLSPVTVTVSPKDPTAKSTVEYFVNDAWTTEPPTQLGTYPVRARVTASENLVLSENYTEATLTITETDHDLRYTAEGAVMTEVCSRGDHTATATLTAADAVYSGEAVGTAAVTYSDGWLGGELTVTYANNVSAGTATATVTKAGATAAVRFEIAKCADCTLALGSLNQTIERLSPVTVTVSPKDPTAKSTVEYFVNDAWTTEPPTQLGTYPVRARVTASENLALSESYTEATLTISKDLPPIEVIYNADGSITVILNKITSDPVKLPLTVPKGTPIRFILRAEVDSAAAELPLAQLSESSVVVRVAADGSESVLPMTPMTKSGIVAEITGSMTLKVIDNAQHYKDANGWASGAISFVSSRKLFNGVGADRFDQKGTMTRGMLVTVIHRMEGKPTPVGTHSFGDVPSGTWFSEAVRWAAGAGVVTGYSKTVFAPDDPITREQMVAMLYRRSGSPKTAYVETGASAWARDAMSWAVSIGLIQGSEKGYAPKDNATRAEAAAILMRFINLTT